MLSFIIYFITLYMAAIVLNPKIIIAVEVRENIYPFHYKATRNGSSFASITPFRQ
jgi:Na+/serine symporter